MSPPGTAGALILLHLHRTLTSAFNKDTLSLFRVDVLNLLIYMCIFEEQANESFEEGSFLMLFHLPVTSH